jgi:fructosamine-3-kinase
MPDGPELFEAAAEALGLKLVSAVPTAGGDINSAWKLGLGDGSTTFLKSRAGAPPEEFEMEAAGLEWLGSAGGLRVPEVLAVVREPQPGLLLEWIEPGGRLGDPGEEAFGRGLRGSTDPPVFGALPPGALGPRDRPAGHPGR